MIITKEWLDESILLNDQGSYQLSTKQMELLHQWLPELFKEGDKIAFIKHWNKRIIDKELSDFQAFQFKKAKTPEHRNYQKISEHLKQVIAAGIQFCEYATNKTPQYRHDRLIGEIGHIPEVDIYQVIFTPEPDNLTVVRFTFEDSENFKNLECIRGGAPIITKDGKKIFDTKLFAIIPPAIYGEDEETKLLKDCTGKDVVECINELRRKKKLIIKRKPITLTAANPDEELKKTCKQKDKEHKAAAKFAQKNGLGPIQPRSDFERLYDMFIDDFNKVNKKRTQKNLPELSVMEFAAKANIDMQNALSLMTYIPGSIDWETMLK